VLSTALKAVQRLMEPEETSAGYDTLSPKASPDESQVCLQLMDVKSSSAAYKFISSDPEYTRTVLADLGKSLADPENSSWGEHRLNSIDELSGIAKHLA